MRGFQRWCPSQEETHAQCSHFVWGPVGVLASGFVPCHQPQSRRTLCSLGSESSLVRSALLGSLCSDRQRASCPQPWDGASLLCVGFAPAPRGCAPPHPGGVAAVCWCLCFLPPWRPVPGRSFAFKSCSREEPRVDPEPQTLALERWVPLRPGSRHLPGFHVASLRHRQPLSWALGHGWAEGKPMPGTRGALRWPPLVLGTREGNPRGDRQRCVCAVGRRSRCLRLEAVCALLLFPHPSTRGRWGCPPW